MGGRQGDRVIQTLLEPKARLAAQRVSCRGPADRDRIEDGRLDDDRGRPLPDLARGTAHDAGDGQWPARVGDQQGVPGQVAPDVIERLEALSGPCQPDADRALCDGCTVEHVDRLAELEHHVVAGIDDVGDRALPGGRQAKLDVERRRPDDHAVDPAAHEAAAQPGVFDGHGDVFAGAVTRAQDLDSGQSERGAGRGRDLARQADDRERVAAIRLDVDVEDDIAVQAPSAADRWGSPPAG